jgi:hypothetical protein
MKEQHSFTDKNGKRWTACCECDRAGMAIDERMWAELLDLPSI